MYYYLHGLISLHNEDSIIVECSGIGYDVLVSHPSDFPIGEIMYVYVTYIQNENEQYFVGFPTLAEKKMFSALTSVKGIGPKTAIQALASTSVERLAYAIEHEDSSFLMRLPGIGKKSSSQLILDLKGKLMLLDSSSRTLNKEMDAAREGLKAFGFKENEIKEVLNSITEMNLTADEYLKKALIILNSKKN